MQLSECFIKPPLAAGADESFAELYVIAAASHHKPAS
jgi:hypothetical protein